MGLKGSGTVPPCGTHIAPTLQDLPKVTQLISGRAGPELFCPASLEKDLPVLSRVGPAGSPLREAALVPPPAPPGPGQGQSVDAGLGPGGWYPGSSLALGPWAATASSKCGPPEGSRPAASTHCPTSQTQGLGKAGAKDIGSRACMTESLNDQRLLESQNIGNRP